MMRTINLIVSLHPEERVVVDITKVLDIWPAHMLEPDNDARLS
jgi:hypothetical protein